MKTIQGIRGLVSPLIICAPLLIADVIAMQGAAYSQQTSASLIGSAWKVQFPNNPKLNYVTGNLYVFCNSGKWEFIPHYRGIGPNGTYQLRNGVLTTLAWDGMKAKYKVVSRGSTIDLISANSSDLIRLHYYGPSKC